MFVIISFCGMFFTRWAHRWADRKRGWSSRRSLYQVHLCLVSEVSLQQQLFEASATRNSSVAATWFGDIDYEHGRRTCLTETPLLEVEVLCGADICSSCSHREENEDLVQLTVGAHTRDDVGGGSAG